MTTKCVIYRRYSSDEQGKGQGDTLQTQLEACEAYAARKGWTVTEVLTDEGFSAYKGEHLLPPAALAKFVDRVMVGEIEKGTILLAFKQNRLSRRPLDEAMVWIFSLTSRGIGIATVDTETVYEANPSIENYLGMSLKRALAHKESADKSDLIIKAKAKLWDKAERKEGKWVNLAARPPLWLSRNEACTGWIINSQRAALIRDIYELSASGLGAVAIANRLNALPNNPAWGIQWRYSDGMWSRGAVRGILVNPAVEGDFVGLKGMFEGKVLHDFYPRIVDADLVGRARTAQKARVKTFTVGPKTNAARVALARPSARTLPKPKASHMNLFAGLTVCGICGKRAHLGSSISKGRYYSYLRCEASAESRCTNKDYYSYGAFERTAMNLCLDLALDDRFFEATGELREAKIALAELEKQVADKRSRRKRIMTAFGEGDDEAEELLTQLRAEIETLTGLVTVAKDQIERSSGKVSAVEHLRRVGDIREAAVSKNAEVRQQARARLKRAFAAIVHTVEIERTGEGQRVFTLIFLGGILAVRIDTKGQVVARVDEALGQPLYEFLSEDQKAVVEPLMKRIQAAAA